MTLPLALALLSLGWTDPPAAGPPPATALPAAPADLIAALETAIADAVARAEPSVVAINRIKGENPQETLAVRGRPRPQPADSRGPRPRFFRDPDTVDAISFDFGSGVVIGDQGQILTAYHVVRGAARLTVRAAVRQQFEAEIIAADPRSDLAVIAPVASPGVPPPKLRPIGLGDAEPLRKGSFLIALGNPFNAAQDGRPSASWGILSNLARRIQPDPDDPMRRLSFPNYPTLLQLDAKLNLGMSGGAVVNLRGELVGLTTMASSPAGFDAMAGYAMPLDRLGRRAVETLRQGREIEYGLLGIRSRTVPATNRVEEISPNSPADQGQLQVGDEIVAVDGTAVDDWDTLILAINAHAPGDEVRLKVRRAGMELNRTVVLAKYPVDPETIATTRPPAWKGLRVDYLSTLSGTPGILPLMELRVGGVVVTEVEEDSPAARAGLKKFQVIRQVDGNPVANPRTFARAVAEKNGPITLVTDQGTVTLGE
jgi:S1-C subfamily serine protease